MNQQEFSAVEIPQMYAFLDESLSHKGLELIALSSRDTSIKEFDKEELENGYESIKLCLADKEGEINRASMSKAYVLRDVKSHKAALADYANFLNLLS